MIARLALLALLALSLPAVADAVAVNPTGAAEGENLAVSGTGDARGFWAVSGTGNATGWAPDTPSCGSARGCGIAASGTGNARASSAYSVTGDASGYSPLSVTGTCNRRACYAVETEEDAHAERLGISVEGDASGQFLAVSRDGDADGDWGSATLSGKNGRCGAAYVPPCWQLSLAERAGPSESCLVYSRPTYAGTCAALP